MKQIDERVDLSRKVLDVNIESPIFEPMLAQLNKQIIETIKKVYEGEFESGDIALKIALSVPKEIQNFPVENDVGEQPTVKTYEYKILSFKHNITTTLKQVDKDEGVYLGKKELKEGKDGEFIEVPIKEPQISMFDKAEGE